jgi:hypothetical protein
MGALMTPENLQELDEMTRRHLAGYTECAKEWIDVLHNSVVRTTLTREQIAMCEYQVSSSRMLASNINRMREALGLEKITLEKYMAF